VDSPSALLASRRHTWIFFGILGLLTAISAFNSRGTPSPAQSLQIYVFLIGAECLWVRFVYVGMKSQGRSLREFIAPQPVAARDVGLDIGLAALVLLLIHLGIRGLEFLPLPAQHGNPLMTTLPSGVLAQGIWVVLSLAAGVGEEIVFRGYLQRQLAVLTGGVVLAIALQAVAFAVGHVYEGAAAVVNIIFIGLVFGVLAQWRGNIRACMLAHVTIDVVAGFGVAIA
jgi:membrane protease YdiL (CAAX protease family)